VTPRRILLVGSNGLLGQKTAEFLVRGTDHQVLLASQEEKPVRPMAPAEYVCLDITAGKEVRRVVADFAPEAVINAAAMTNVDACETEREAAWKVNVEGVEHLIEASRKTGAALYHVSTDYVFDGKAGPYAEDDPPAPLSYYGKTKLASENALRAAGIPFFIARTIVLYGFAHGVKANFVLWLLQNLEQGSPVRIVDDQFANPTLVDDLAYALVKAVELKRTGLYHIAGRDVIHRHAMALAVAKVFGLDAGLITPVRSSTLRQAAPRPLRSGLVTLKAETELGYRPSTVEEGLQVMKNQMARTLRQLADGAPLPGGGRHTRR
jgi:dTDP-4-dehydrorhamnose reductase